MQPASSGLDQIKERMRATWSAGDFGRIARYTEKAAEEFVGRLNLKPGARVLDVACGTGNLAIPAARLGARVSGADIAPHLLAQARERAAAERLEAKFEEGDAEQLRYPDGEFDLVMSMFGAMFAPRPEVVAAELARVCRPGGTIAMANWAPEGFIARQFAIGNRYVPPPPGIPAPILWGDETVARKRLGPHSSDIQATRRGLRFEYPYSPREVVQFFREYFGPAQAAFARLDQQSAAAYEADLEQLWSEHNESPSGTTVVRAEYLEVIARRA